MKKRNLPIRIFSKREVVDECYVEGMGGDKLKKWALEGEELIFRSNKLKTELEIGKDYFKEKRENKFIPLTVTATIIEDAKAKSYRKKITNLFSTNKKNNVVGMIDDDNILIKIDNDKDLSIVMEQLGNIDKNIEAISAVEEIKKFKPYIDYSKDLSKSKKVKLINYANYELNHAVKNSFEKLCRENNLNLKTTNYTEELVIYKISNITTEALGKIEKFEAIYSIEDMPTYSTYDFNTQLTGKNVDVKNADPSEDYPVVGVIDSGIESNQYLDSWIMEENNKCHIDEDLEKSHGTFVAGIIAYGDELEGKEYTGVKGCKVFDAAIFNDSMDQDDLIDQIDKCLNRYSDKIKIWNLSIGTRTEADLELFSDFGVALDQLQDKYDVVICKSAGNSREFISGAPKPRIAKSADSVRSVVVGSIAHKKNTYDLAEVNYPSPFTRIGRGPSFIIKPDLVHYGGNAGINQMDELDITGVYSFSKDGEIIENVGTSFSTPRVSTILAGIQNEINEEFDPLLVKALAIHSASYPDNVEMPISEKINQFGFGVPNNVNDILHNQQNEITLVMRDQLSKGEYIEILDFPYPKSLSEDDYYYGQIIVTVVYNPILDYSQASEYCQSDIKVHLGTYNDKSYRDITKSYIKNPIGKTYGKNLLNQSCYSKKGLKSNVDSFSKKEKLLIQYGDKYYPVKKYAIDLEDATNANKIKYLGKDRNWYLKIEGTYRDAAEKKAEELGYDLYQDICVIVTIRDNKNEDNHIYNEVSAILDYHNFYHSSIRLKHNIEVNVDDEETEVDLLIDELMGEWDEE
ncbi:S8 family peptidase [Paraclostridium sordellii]|uniref:S8 family peptidase n=1 Tax=Paraclostridium sordellii TaxID=1505 RepID=UPI0005E4C931|nr:S8 family peptidase [Paeniclostridium sordellii]CEQ20887.1 Subtilase family [[Clostridium] sordellii] [Paeniclostridium sordellii]